MTGIPGPDLDPRHLAIVGARSWEPEELERLTRLGVRIFFMPEIRTRGLRAVLADAFAHAADGTAAFGVSLDLDSVDCAQLPATTCLVPDGIDATELADALGMLRGDARLAGFEIVEYVPERDRDGRGAEWVARFAGAALGPDADALIARERTFGAHNYAPLPAVFCRGEREWLWDVAGRRYLDMTSAYSAVSFGHAPARLVNVLAEQAGRLTLTSRAAFNDRLPLLLERLCALTGYARALPVNTGVEAVETALKAARKWAYRAKRVAPDRARIIACEGNFHGRTTTVVGFSSEPGYRDGFGPFAPGFDLVPFGDAAALAAAIGPDTAAFLVEPVQGEGGIRVPPDGWLAECAEICRRRNVLLIADEVQTGLGRTGKLFACEWDGVRPDGLILGKALGGGLVPAAAFLADDALMGVFGPGDHGSTFGGNPLASAVALEALAMLVGDALPDRTARLGPAFMEALRALKNPLVREIRGRGLMIGLELVPGPLDAHGLAEALLARGILAKDTREHVLRLTPPLIVAEESLAWAAGVIGETLARFAGARG